MTRPFFKTGSWAVEYLIFFTCHEDVFEFLTVAGHFFGFGSGDALGFLSDDHIFGIMSGYLWFLSDGHTF